MAHRQETAPREGLVPKQITDVNGHPKTVWVRPEDLKPARSASFADLKPVLRRNLEENIRDLRGRGGPRSTMADTPLESSRRQQRGYGGDELGKAAARRFEAEYGVPFAEASAPRLTDERIYDYLSSGVTNLDQAAQFAAYGIEPHLTHPKMDPQYTFMLGSKGAAAERRQQVQSDPQARKRELRDIIQTARFLQERGVPGRTAAACLENGLRMKHLRDPRIDPSEAVRVSAKHKPDSPQFRAMAREDRASRAEDYGKRLRAEVGGHMKIWARRLFRRVLNRVRRRVRRILRKSFLPWEYR